MCTTNSPPESIDAAAFARVMTWDPAIRKQMPERGKEFPAEFVFPGRELAQEADGYRAPVWRGGRCVIGLQWEINRCLRSVGLVVADPGELERLDACVEYWRDFGEEKEGSPFFGKKGREWPGSFWQGEWTDLNVTPTREGDRLVCQLDDDHPLARKGTMKLRWVIGPRTEPLMIAGLSAEALTTWKRISLRVEAESTSGRGRATISVYDGGLPGADPGSGSLAWDTAQPMVFDVVYSQPLPDRPDTRYSNRTLLTFTLEDAAFSVAVEDVVERGAVYVPFADVCVSRADDGRRLVDCRALVESRNTLRAQVREKPDQSLRNAMAHRNPCADSSPTVLSLACNNRKFILLRSGALLTTRFQVDPRHVDDEFFCISPRFGVERYQEQSAATWTQGWGKANPGRIRRWLDEGWLPIVHNSLTEGPIEYRQCAFVAPLEEHEPQSQQWCGDCPSVGVVEYTVENTGGGEAQASLELLFESRSQDPPPGLSKPRVPKYAAGADGTFRLEGEKVFAIVNASGCDALQFDYRDGVLALSGTLAAGERAALRVFVYEKSTPATHVSDGPDRARELRLAAARYWTSALSSACTIRTPEELVNNILRSSLVRILIAARNEGGGRRVAPWIAAFAYGALENESQTIIQCMTRFGFTGFARRALDYFRHRYNDQGLLSTGYTMMGTPWNLWAIAEHYDATGDRQWLTAMAPLMRSACAWIVRQRRKTMAMDARGEKVPEYGLVPPGVTGDWSRFGYRFYAQAIYHAGLANAARVLQEIGDPAGAALVEEARAFRADIVRAYRIAQSRHPVLPLPNQAWVRPYPCMIYGRGRAGLLFPSGNRGSTYTYDTDHGALHLAALGVLDPVSPDVDEMLDEIEEIAYLDPCFHNALYSVERNHKLWFDCGGFSKHYVGLSRIGDVYAQRDEPRLFIRSLFNCIPAALDCENLTFWEHGIGAAWDKSHHAAAILLNFRTMFVQERGAELWLAPFVPTHYLADGNEIWVRNAPTAFGAVSYRLHSHAQAGFIDARIDPPKRRQPTSLVLRARHPDAKPIASVSVNDKPHRDFDANQGTVRLPLGTERLQLRIEY